MTDKYLIYDSTGAAICGDGTSPSIAATPGGVGAWTKSGAGGTDNDALKIFDGGLAVPYGTLAGGDTVYIRSKDYGTGNNITRTASAAKTIGAAAATISAPITWVIDGGTKWPGIDGTLTFTRSATAAHTMRSDNNLYAENYEKLVFVNPLTNPAWQDYLLVLTRTKIRNALLDESAITGSSDVTMIVADYANELDNCHLKFGNSSLSTTNCHIAFSLNANSVHKLTLLNCHVEYTYQNASRVLLRPNANYAGLVEFIGGRISGYTATQYLTRLDCGANLVNTLIEGTQVPANYTMCYVTGSQTAYMDGFIEAVGIDSGGVGGHFERPSGFFTSRTDNNPPYRKAELPNSTLTKWAWRAYCRFNDMASVPLRIVCMKAYTDTAAAKTITLEVLKSNAFAAGVGTKATVWMTVSYIDDATGEAVGLSTRTITPDALDVSTDTNWSSTGWGLVTLDKKKFIVTTPTSIKKDTVITATLHIGVGSSDSTAIWFIDSDISVL